MTKQYTLALLPLLVLAGCNGEEQSVESTSSGYLSYSYPTDGQSGVSPEADVVMRFSHAITDEEADSKIQLMKDGQKVGYSLEKVDGGRSVVLSPDDGLEAKAEYTVTFADPLSGADGASIDMPIAEGEPGIQFATRTLFDGPNHQVEATDSFEVASAVPAAGQPEESAGDFGPMNFSTFRLKTTHPVHPQWEDKGGSVELTDSNDEPVDAKVIIRGNSISVDPA